jgi:hypothetical protein
MNKKTARISSKLYFDLFVRGGDKLIAVYAILKTSRKGDVKYYAYTAKNNKFVSCYSLLRAKTNLSLSTLKKYVPILIDMELCSFHTNGDFVMLGGEKVKELYDSYKMIPVEIGKNIIETTLNCYKIKVHSAEKQQLNQIRIKQNRSVLLSNKSNPKNNKEYKAICKLEKKYGSEITVNDKTVLSNKGFGKLKNGEMNKKSVGNYWKRKLVKNNFIKTTRQYELGEKMSYEAYLQFKNNYSFRGLTYIKGRIAVEKVSEFSVIKNVKESTVLLPISNKEVIKPLSYLSFDFVAWLSNK